MEIKNNKGGNPMQFAQFFKARRMASGLTMRKFADERGYDVGYISRLENGLLNPPAENEKLDAMASALAIIKNSEDWMTFIDLAAAARREIPFDLKQKDGVINMLPAFYRTMRQQKISEDDVHKLLAFIKKEGENEETDR